MLFHFDRRAPLAASVAALVMLAAAGCGDRVRPVAELADYVDHQAGNVTTDLLRAADGRGLERLQSGWLISRATASADDHLEIASRLATLSFFSVDGEATAVEIEATVPDSATGRHRLSLRLNERLLPATKQLGTGRHRYRFELPAAALRAGENTLQVLLQPRRARAGPHRPSAVRVHGIAWIPSDGRPPRRARPGRIETRDEKRGRIVEIPAPGRFDMVIEMPPRARLSGRLRVEFDAGPPAPLEVRIDLLDEAGVEHPLYRRAAAEPFDDRLRLDLAAWAGKLAQLRIVFDGATNGILELLDVRLEGTPPTSLAAPFPTSLEPGPASRRLGGGDVLVILLDAARADAFSPYGGEFATPTAERLAAAGTRFARATAPSSWTGQSVPAIFTGLHPDAIGMEQWGSRLPAAVPTLAERFRAAGYRTVLWSQHPFYRSQIELVRGFETVVYGRPDDPGHLPTAEELVGDDPRPLFAFVHLLPPHTPYTPPPPFRGAYTAGYRGSLEPDARTLNAFPTRRDPSELSAEDRRYIRGRYQENVTFADALAGRVVDLLHEAGRYDEATVALISDHGEAFLEHGRFLHGLHVYAEFVRVPMIVKWPASFAGFQAVVEGPVSLVDLAPTLADGAGLEAGGGFQGRTLLPTVLRQPSSPPPPVYAYTRGIADGRRPPRPKHLLEADGWKIVVDRSAATHHLYRSDDPLDREDLTASFPLRALFLRQQALRQAAFNRQLRDGLGTLEARDLDAETVERLRALGYL